MAPDMAIDHFRHERIHRTSASGDVVQDFRAVGFEPEASLNGCNLTHDPVDAVQDLLLVFDCMCHCVVAFTGHGGELYKHTAGGICCLRAIHQKLHPNLTGKEAFVSDGGGGRIREQQADSESAEHPSLARCL